MHRRALTRRRLDCSGENPAILVARFVTRRESHEESARADHGARRRGGATSLIRGDTARKGLSPPTRGSQDHKRTVIHTIGSIPAHAGEPPCAGATGCTSWVYPRPRGGAIPPPLPTRTGQGLSPPTRGSRSRRSSTATCMTVYPRPRGGASKRSSRWAQWRGLSPPTRGSRRANGHCGGSSGVYPRPRGGAGPSRLVVQAASARSIPAHAGEPSGPTSALRSWWVYPRPRGGASEVWGNMSPEDGLSPPTRGSPASRFLTCSSHGLSPPTRGSRSTMCCPADRRSIPAHAGEPRTSRVACPPRHPSGLSPPTRGSRVFRERATPPDWWVYPRPRGGAPVSTADRSVY